jgi:exonuclease III
VVTSAENSVQNNIISNQGYVYNNNDPSKVDFANLTFSSQNCNSLNISTNCPKQMKKIAAILALQTSIIFLSDIRLNTGTTGELNNLFSPNYNFYHNSIRSKRGVGILISNKLQYSVLQSYTDNNDNILGLKLRFGDSVILLISVYGPNQNNDCFFPI